MKGSNPAHNMYVESPKPDQNIRRHQAQSSSTKHSSRDYAHTLAAPSTRPTPPSTTPTPDPDPRSSDAAGASAAWEALAAAKEALINQQETTLILAARGEGRVWCKNAHPGVAAVLLLAKIPEARHMALDFAALAILAPPEVTMVARDPLYL